MPGTIVFKPIEANLTHDTDLLTKMNPYCTFIVGNQRFNSQVCKKGGKHPVWNEAITVPNVNENDKILVEVMDKDKITSDDVIGTFMLDLRELASQQRVNKWYPLFYKNKPAGELLLEADFRGESFGQTGLAQGQTGEFATTESSLGMAEREDIGLAKGGFIAEESATRQGLIGEEHRQIYTEQKQVVEPHTFMKEVDVVETRPVLKEIEVMEPSKVLKEVQVTEAVPVTKQIEVNEPHVVKKEIEAIEPRLVTKQIQVVENVPVKKEVEVIESVPIIKEVETFEPQTFTKQVEVTEQVPVKKQVTVTEPVTLKKPVEYVEPIITTQTITKEVQPAVVVDERITTEVGPASVIDVKNEVRQTGFEERVTETQFREQQMTNKNLGNVGQFSTSKETEFRNV